MKRFLPVFVLMFVGALAASAQTQLPTSFDFETTPTTLPTGWSTNTTDFYVTGVTGISGKMSDGGPGGSEENWHQFTIHVSEEPGPINYWLGSSSSGTFGACELRESLDGTSWNTVRTFVTNDLPGGGSFMQFHDTLDRDARWIRFIYTDDQSGSNVAIDDVEILDALPSTAAEINVGTNAGGSIVSGGSTTVAAPVGDSIDFTIEIHNLGTQDSLYVSGAALSGTFASEFTILNSVDTVGPTTFGSLDIRFKPTADGTRPATLTITNSDSNEGTYVVELNGIGGDYASEPTATANALVLSNVTSWSMDANISGSTTMPDGYLVLRRNNAAVADAPADGMTYMRGDMIGTSKVAYVGDPGDFDVNDVVADREVHFSVFSYNGAGQYTNYFDSAPLVTSQSASGNMMGNYYAGLDENDDTFVSDLMGRIASPHVEVFYSNYEQLLIPHVYARDTTGGANVVNCMYSSDVVVYSGPFNWTLYNFAREHTYAKAWMDHNGNIDQDDPPGADLHNLHPTNQNDVNAPRSADPFGIGTSIDNTYLDATFWDGPNGNLFEPRDSHKGDIARSVLYMMLRWVHDDTWGSDDWLELSLGIYKQDIAILKTWNDQDPPSAFEIARNDYIESEQRNRNPFIDNPDWVDLIDFTTVSPVSVEDRTNVQDLTIMPNPNNGAFRVSFNMVNGESVDLTLVDLAGKVVWTGNLNGAAGYNFMDFTELNLKSGAYVLQSVSRSGGIGTQKVLVN